jgi:Domain of Unknown Function (DUF1080)
MQVIEPFSRRRIALPLFLGTAVALSLATALRGQTPVGQELPPPKDEPRVVTPGPQPAAPSGAPSDAIVLFDGKDLSNWKSANGAGPAKWTIEDGAMVVAPKAGDIMTKETFGDVQLHIEWATPTVIEGEGQGRGNSGVFLQERYEVQILDSYQNKTYFHGQAGAIYKQHAPLVNASRKPGEWQTYDIVFRAPVFDASGKVTKAARITAFHNGVLIQDHAEVFGTTSHVGAPVYKAHGEAGIRLQDHGNPMRFRNIWVRKL